MGDGRGAARHRSLETDEPRKPARGCLTRQGTGRKKNTCAIEERYARAIFF
jgi:hypothetical protein